MSGPVSAAVPPPPTHYAGFWIRWAATIIDGFVLVGAGIIIGLTGGSLAALANFDSATGVGAGYFLTFILGSWLYFAGLESSPYQATLGKRALRVFVTDAHGQRISFARASGRAFAKWLDALTLGIGWVMSAFTAQKRGLHDFVAGTVVVSRQAPRPSVPLAAAIICAVPIVGIVAAIAVPGFVRARISGNEAVAIGSLQAINAAQRVYMQQCNGYASSLPELTKIGRLDLQDATWAGSSANRSGYTIQMSPTTDAAPVRNIAAGCIEPVSDYVAQAAPLTPGTTGARYFSTDSRGTIFEDTANDFRNSTAIR